MFVLRLRNQEMKDEIDRLGRYNAECARRQEKEINKKQESL